MLTGGGVEGTGSRATSLLHPRTRVIPNRGIPHARLNLSPIDGPLGVVYLTSLVVSHGWVANAWAQNAVSIPLPSEKW